MTWFFHEHKWKRKHNPKLQVISRKPHAPIFRGRKLQAASIKQAIQETVPQCDIAEANAQPEVASDKLQASSTKRR
jgi:hypothetical protein